MCAVFCAVLNFDLDLTLVLQTYWKLKLPMVLKLGMCVVGSGLNTCVPSYAKSYFDLGLTFALLKYALHTLSQNAFSHTVTITCLFPPLIHHWICSTGSNLNFNMATTTVILEKKYWWPLLSNFCPKYNVMLWNYLKMHFLCKHLWHCQTEEAELWYVWFPSWHYIVFNH